MNYAQNNIDKLSEYTGAESYFLGFGTPVSIKPYLDEIGMHLSNQYLLTFRDRAERKGSFEYKGEDGIAGRGAVCSASGVPAAWLVKTR